MKYESINLKNNEIEGADNQEIKIEIIDLVPEREKTSTPVLFAPGWGITLETLNEPLNLLVEEGYRVLSLSHSRETLKINSDEHNLAELQKAYALLALLEQKNIEKVDAVAHSEGGN